MWNSLQPKRDLQGVDARTHINEPLSIYNVFNWKNQIAQLVLYRWCRSEEYIDSVAIGELHEYLFWKYPYVTKRQMGMAVVQATTYNPRKLKGVTSDNPKACMTYVWPNRLDLQYGLEWQLAMWVWALEDDFPQASPEKTLEIFNEIAMCEGSDFESLYVNPVMERDFAADEDVYLNVTWPTLWARHGWETEDWKPAPTGGPRTLRRVD